MLFASLFTVLLPNPNVVSGGVLAQGYEDEKHHPNINYNYAYNSTFGIKIVFMYY